MNDSPSLHKKAASLITRKKICHYLKYKPSNGVMIDELWTRKDLEGISHGLIKVLIDLAFTCRDWGKPWKISVGIDGVPAEIQTEHLPNTNLENSVRTDHPFPYPLPITGEKYK
jgi:hypothetical protein